MTPAPPPRGVVNVAEINPHAPRPYTFTEAALCLRDSIRAAGYTSDLHVNRADTSQRCIVLGALPPNLPAVEQLDARRAAIYNLEQLPSAPVVIGSDYTDWLRHWLVADYHQANIDHLARSSAGAQRAIELPLVPGAAIAFRPELPIERSVDVLFFGTVNDRRSQVLEQLQSAGLSVEVVAGAFADELTPALRRARLVLHVHFYDSGLFPVARVLQPVVQGVPIVCEHSVFSPLSPWSSSGIVFAPYEGLVQACRQLLASDREQYERVQRNREFAAAIDFAAPLERLLAALEAMPQPAGPTARAAAVSDPANGTAGPVPVAAPVPVRAPAAAPAAAPARAAPVAPGEPSVAGDEAPLTTEEIEAILAAEAQDLPPEGHVEPAPLKLVERIPGQGRFGAILLWLLIAFSLFTVWRTFR